MATQPGGGGPFIPAAAAGLGKDTTTDDQSDVTTDAGVPVGEADADADAQRSGAGDGGGLPGEGGATSVPGTDAGEGTDSGIPVGSADVEADRERTTESEGD